MRETISETIKQYLNYCDNVRQMTPATLRTKRYVLYMLSEQLKIETVSDLTWDVYVKWVEERKAQGLNRNYINDLIKTITLLMKFYEFSGHQLSLNPHFIPLLQNEAPRRNFFTRDVIMKVIDNADGKTALMIRIAYETGMRINELRTLRLANFDGNHVTYIGKGRKAREGYISAETLSMLNQYKAFYGITNYLWEGREKNTPAKDETIRKYMQKAFKDCGIEGFYPHSLRHSFATDLQLKGATTEEIRVMMGHESTQTTDNYLHGLEGGAVKILYEKYQKIA